MIDTHPGEFCQEARLECESIFGRPDAILYSQKKQLLRRAVDEVKYSAAGLLFAVERKRFEEGISEPDIGDLLFPGEPYHHYQMIELGAEATGVVGHAGREQVQIVS